MGIKNKLGKAIFGNKDAEKVESEIVYCTPKGIESFTEIADLLDIL